MSDSNATYELRRLLDERGVEWKDDDGVTEWFVDGMTCRSLHRVTIGIEHLALYIPVLAPQQAVAATLGHGKQCFATNYTHEHCKYSVNKKWMEDTRFYIPTLGRGECEWDFIEEIKHEFQYPDWIIKCSACGYTLQLPNGEYPNYCAQCGARNKAVKR